MLSPFEIRIIIPKRPGTIKYVFQGRQPSSSGHYDIRYYFVTDPSPSTYASSSGKLKPETGAFITFPILNGGAPDGGLLSSPIKTLIKSADEELPCAG